MPIHLMVVVLLLVIMRHVVVVVVVVVVHPLMERTMLLHLDLDEDAVAAE